jgi:hypothetical protein
MLIDLPYAAKTDEGGATGLSSTFLADPSYNVRAIYKVEVSAEWYCREGLAFLFSPYKPLVVQRLIPRRLTYWYRYRSRH